MAKMTINLPDVGEGIAEAELTEWAVKVGDHVNEDDILGTVMTDKAAIEVPSSVTGTVTWLCGEPGDTIAIGSRFVEIETDGAVAAEAPAPVEVKAQPTPPADAPQPEPGPEPVGAKLPDAGMPDRAVAPKTPPAAAPAAAFTSSPQRRTIPLGPGEKPLASPAVRQRARDAGIDLRLIGGTGPAGRITHADLDAWIAKPDAAPASGPRGRVADTSTKEVKIIGMRRKIAEKMTVSASRIPHITIVEEVDVTALEELREKLNGLHAGERGKLTVLPFLMRAIVAAVREQPEFSSTYDDEAGILHVSGGVHIGIATQTPAGLTVPVVRHAEALSLWQSAAEVSRLAEAARAGKATRDELSGSTISITSLGPLGAIATTPIINHPEVAIVGVNRMAVRPLWDGQEFRPRKVMNLSSSFDHRIIDGWDAAIFVQKLKTLLETPALLFVEE